MDVRTLPKSVGTMSMPALSLWQPWASLLVTRQPCDCEAVRPDTAYGHHPDCGHNDTVKRFETRSWPCPEKWWGQHMAFHAAARRVTPGDIGHYHVEQLRHDAVMYEIGAGDDIDLPLGAVVGSGVVAACYPIVGYGTDRDHGGRRVIVAGDRLFCQTSHDPGVSPDDISDQLPYGDFTPGRFAWLIEDAAPTTERCPWCWGIGKRLDVGWPHGFPTLTPCPVCKGAGRCEPIPAKGRQRIWHWTPELVDV